MSIEKDIRFIAESIEWQNKFLADIFSNKDSDSCSNERNSKEIADLPTKMLKGQPELTIDSKAVAKVAQDDF